MSSSNSTSSSFEDLVDRGKRRVKRAENKVIDKVERVVGKMDVMSKICVADENNEDRKGKRTAVARGSSGAESSSSTATSMPTVSEHEAAVPPQTTVREEQIQYPIQFVPKSVSQPQPQLKPANTFLNNVKGLSTEAIMAIYTALLAAYQAWSFKSDILSNQIPVSVVFPCFVAAFLLGFTIAPNNNVVDDDNKINQPGDESGVDAAQQTSERGTSFSGTMTPRSKEVADTNEKEDVYFSRTKHLVRRGKTHLKSFGRRYMKILPSDTTNSTAERSGGIGGLDFNTIANPQLFFTHLSPHKDAKAHQKKLRAPFFDEALMDHLLKYSDFKRSKMVLRKRKSDDYVEDSVQESNEMEEGGGVLVEEDKEVDIAMGRAPLLNTKAESLGEENDKLAYVVDSMCELRGMDLFLTDDPEEEVWRLPLLNECGLRDVPTLVANLMFPFGNMVAYFKMPDWIPKDLSEIPKETEDDPPDVKALKRFLLGDDEYRNARCKVIPHIVDGPLAIRMIKPKPAEHLVWGPRHPATWSSANKSIDPVTGKAKAAILEVDVDLFSNKTVRKVINIFRPHIASITVDIALVISTPNDSDVEEPCACLGLWRMEKVDFESCAIFPELQVEEAAKEINLILSQMSM